MGWEKKGGEGKGRGKEGGRGKTEEGDAHRCVCEYSYHSGYVTNR